MTVLDSATDPACTGHSFREGFHVFDEGRAYFPRVCPRTVEILAVLNDVFDGLSADETGLVAVPGSV